MRKETFGPACNKDEITDRQPADRVQDVDFFKIVSACLWLHDYLSGTEPKKGENNLPSEDAFHSEVIGAMKNLNVMLDHVWESLSDAEKFTCRKKVVSFLGKRLAKIISATAWENTNIETREFWGLDDGGAES